MDNFLITLQIIPDFKSYKNANSAKIITCEQGIDTNNKYLVVAAESQGSVSNGDRVVMIDTSDDSSEKKEFDNN